MSLQDWLGDRMPKTEFVARYYGKLPYSQAAGGQPFCELGSWDVLLRIIERPDADVMVVRQNQQYIGPRPRSQAEAQALVAEGYTILVRHAEQHDERLSALAAAFAEDFAAPVNIHIYATPAQQYGFGWHYDCEDVFILQTAGYKEYSLRKNTVHPWPLEESMPIDLEYPREIMPLMRCGLAAGDWLYIPCGYWHKAEAHETALSLAVGVMTPAAVHLLDALRRELLDSLIWRQRLPVQGAAGPLTAAEQLEQLQQLGQQLGADLAKRLTDVQWLEQWLRNSGNFASE